jgi:HEAT repeat protein
MQAVKVLGPTASPAVVARLVALLRNPSARDAARAALVDVGPTATPLLAPLLDDDALRPTVAVVLAYADPARADLYAPVILARLPDDELRRGPASTYVYPHLGPHAAPYLARELGDRTRATCALNTLQRLGEAGAAAMGKALLRTDDWLLRCTLCERLGQLGGQARVALPMLLDLLDDTGNPVVRAAVMRAVREIGPDEATAARLEQLRTDRSPTIRDEAVRILDAIAERER